MDWNMITAISSAVMALVVLITAVIAVLQLTEISKSRKYTVFMDLTQFLQQEEIRKARGTLIGLLGKDFKNWSKDEIDSAEKVCMSYNFLGEMVLSRFIDKDLGIPARRDSIIKCWEAARSMVTEYRNKRGDNLWADFERLYDMSKEYET